MFCCMRTCVLLQPLHTEVLFPFLGTARCHGLGIRASFESHLHFALGGRVLYLLVVLLYLACGAVLSLLILVTDLVCGASILSCAIITSCYHYFLPCNRTSLQLVTAGNMA